MKRKTIDDDSGESRVKLPRTNIEHAHQSSWEVKAGMILEVSLRNFMCHEKFVFKPNQRLNFLCGENGSGKSAILTAIVFGLGGTARTANRGTANKGFIRTGQTSASVDIKLDNRGESSYRPDRYGDAIIVQRTVTNSSSSYKLKNQHGKVVVDKKAKEELDRILAAFNIQVDNPITVLNQDAAKTFLSKSDPGKLYQFFHRATQLKNCEEDYLQAHKDKQLTEALLKDKRDTISELKKEKAKWEKKWEFFENLEGRREDIIKLKEELAWAVVRDLGEEVQELEAKASREEKKAELADNQLKAATEAESEWKNKKRSVEAEIAGLAKIKELEEEKIDQCRRILKSYQSKSKDAKRSLTELNSAREQIEKDEKILSEMVDKFKTGQFVDYELRHKQRVDEIKALEKEIEALAAQAKTTVNHADHLEENKRSKDAEIKNTRYELEESKRKLQKTNQELVDLQKGEKGRLSAFGNWMPKLVNEIKACRSFSKKPIGPIGTMIKVKECADDNDSRLVENELWQLLTGFCVDNTQDQRVLYSLFEKLKLRQKPTIFTTPFSANKYDISQKRVRSEKFTTMIDILDIDDPTVYNCIVDNCSLEKILLIPSCNEAQHLLMHKENVPLNLKYALAGGRYTYYPAPNYRSYYIEIKSKGVIKASMDEYISGLKSQVTTQKAEVAQIDERLSQEIEEMKQIGILSQEESKKLEQLRTRMREKNTKINLTKNEDDAEQPPDMAAMEDDLNQCRKKLELLASQLSEAEKHVTECKEKVNEAGKELERVEHEQTTKLDSANSLTEELTTSEDAIRKCRRDKDHYVAKKQEYVSRKKKYDAEVNERKLEVEKSVTRAKSWSVDRIESRRKTDTLSREIARLEENLQQQKDAQEPREVVRENYITYKKKYESAKEAIIIMDNTISVLDTAIKKRIEGYKLILRSTCKNLNDNFTMQLNAKNFLGFLEFHHSQKTLRVLVDPDGGRSGSGLEINRDLRSLSGGERSFSLVSLILSLWNVMTPPFRILDEFDVFMDAINRRMSILNIINYARDDRRNQFIFLTPLNTSNIAVGEDIKIIKLSKLNAD